MNPNSQLAIFLATILMVTGAANAQTESKTCCKGKGDKATCCQSAACNQGSIATTVNQGTVDNGTIVSSDGLSPTIGCACCSTSDSPTASPIILALDIDKDGIVSAAEIKNATQSLLALDKNRDGRLDRTEMHTGVLGFSKINASTKATATKATVNSQAKKSSLISGTSPNYFAHKMLEADANGNGSLDGAEISPSFFATHGQLPNVRLIDIVDLNKDGTLSFAELRVMKESLKEFQEANSGNGGG